MHAPVARRVLLVEDSVPFARLLTLLLGDLDVAHVESFGEAELTLGRGPRPDVVLLDSSLPDGCGADLVGRVVGAADGVPVVVLSGRDCDEEAVLAVRAGATDHLVKGRDDEDEIRAALDRAVARAAGQPVAAPRRCSAASSAHSSAVATA